MSEHFVIDEGDYRMTFTHTRSRTVPWQWVVVHRVGAPPWPFKDGRASTEEYALHDARTAMRSMRDAELEERAA